MIRTILIILGALFVLFCVVVCYCACVIASREDAYMEKLYLEEEARAIAKSQNAGPSEKEAAA